MERGGVAAKARRRPQTSDARVERGYEILLDTVDVDGFAIEKPKATAIVETDCPVLGSPTIQLSGEPEALNNGVDLIGYMAYGDVPADAA